MSVGIDIGSRSIKIVELAKEGAQFRLKASGIVAYKGITPEHANSEKEMAEVAQAIKKIHREAKITSKEVVLSIPETQVFTRTVRFPLLTDSEIASAVRWEAEQYIPIPINEAVVQHQVIERFEKASPPQVVVLLVAAPKAVIEKFAKVIEIAGLTLIAVESGEMAITRSLAPSDQTVMLVDFGARSTDISIARSGMLVFSRSIPTAGEAFTRAIARQLGVAEQQAEEYKRAYGLSSSQLEGKIREAIDPVFRMVADEMKKAIRFYTAEEKGDFPTSAILSGGTAGMPEATTALARLLGIEVAVGNPFAKIKVDPEALKTLSGYSPLYSIAVGLAMKEV